MRNELESVWIPIKERKPPWPEKFLALLTTGEIVMSKVGGWGGDSYERSPDSYVPGLGYYWEEHITHWMPLPPKPKEKMR